MGRTIVPTALIFITSALGILNAQDANYDHVRWVGDHVYALKIRPVPNAAFKALEELRIRQVLADSTTVEKRMLLHVGRDTAGRTHQESGYFQAASDPTDTPIKTILIVDPVSHTRSTVYPATRTVSEDTLTNRVSRDEIPGGNWRDFGTEILDGESVRHLLSSRTVAAGAQGNDQPLVITDEVWYSPELAMNLMMRHVDPRKGLATMRVLEIRRGDPPAEFFQVPSYYAIPTGTVTNR